MTLINNIRYKKENILHFEKVGRFNYAVTENDNKIPSLQLRDGNLECQCHVCNNWKIKITGWHILNTYFICQSCNKKGIKNSFYGKKHTPETINKIKQNKPDSTGVNNAFYGKHHSIKTKNLLSQRLKGKFSGINNPFYGKKHSQKSLQMISQKNKEFYYNNPDAKERCRKIAIKTLSKNKFRMTSIERLVKQFLLNNNIKHKYNFILKYYQYDFLLYDYKTVIEVQGDYWHANPEKYGEGKKPLNERQLFKIKRDKEKKQFIKSCGYKIIYIWEKDIRKQNFSAIEGILSEKI